MEEVPKNYNLGLVNGFSKMTKQEKLIWVVENLSNKSDSLDKLMAFRHHDTDLQNMIDGFSENTISNFILPYSIAPNFVINDKIYAVPMAIEESSVVAAASNAAKYWSTRGGFKAEILGTTKLGFVHFLFDGDAEKLVEIFKNNRSKILDNLSDYTQNMVRRGGGILDFCLIDCRADLDAYFKLEMKFDTCDSMGANFINTILECVAEEFELIVKNYLDGEIEIIYSILSNYTPECLVKASVTCRFDQLGSLSGYNSYSLAKKFYHAIKIANIDTTRAVTHNKGIFNGIDAVIIATGNDFRAIEACGHAYSARDGKYRGLSSCELAGDIFHFEMTIPLALGTVGGLTSLHPLSKLSLEILGNPSAQELMKIVACVGLAQNFSAVKSLITTGIQKGHMKMHLSNILNELEVSDSIAQEAYKYFSDKRISSFSVRQFVHDKQLNLNT